MFCNLYLQWQMFLILLLYYCRWLGFHNLFSKLFKKLVSDTLCFAVYINQRPYIQPGHDIYACLLWQLSGEITDVICEIGLFLPRILIETRICNCLPSTDTWWGSLCAIGCLLVYHWLQDVFKRTSFRYVYLLSVLVPQATILVTQYSSDWV